MSKKAAVVILLAIIVTGCASARVKAPGVPELTSIEIMENAVALRVSGQFTYTMYKPSDPFNVVIEMPGVVSGVEEKFVSDKMGISEVTVTTTEEPLSTNIQILLDTPSEMEPERTDDSLVLRVAKPVAEEWPEAAEAPPPLTVEPEALPSPLSPATEISDMWFDYFNGTLKVVIKGNGAMTPKVYTLPGRIVVDVPDVDMKAALPEAVIPPVKAVRFGMHRDKVRIVLDMKKDVEYTSAREADSIVISMPAEEAVVAAAPPAVAPAAVPPAERKEPEAEAPEPEGEKRPEAEMKPPEEKKPEIVAIPEAEKPEEKLAAAGKIISLDFQNADIVPIFRFLGDVAGYNVVIHPTVSGRITLKLLNVPWIKALDTVLEISGYDKKIDEKNKIMTIASSDLFSRMETDKAKYKEVVRKVAEPRREDLILTHIDVGTMKKKLDEAKVEACTKPVRVDDRLNALIVYDTEDCISNLKKEVDYWDTPEHRLMQVMIEAKIIEVGSDYSSAFGIKWGGQSTAPGVSILPANTDAEFSVNTPVGTAGPNAVADGGALRFGYVSNIEAALSISALESVGKSRKLSNPRVLTVDGMAATIQQGTQIPVTTVTAAGSQTEFKNANLSLNVTPTIKRSDFIELVVSANNDTPVQVGGQTGINTQSVNTKALVKDGETLVLGGIYTESETESETRVPILGRIPLIGWLFKTKQKAGPSPKELLVFITPRIVR